MLFDDGLGIARLKCGLTEGAEFRDVHRNERVPHYIMREAETLRDPCPEFLQVRHDDRIFRERIGAEPGRKVWLNRDGAFLPDLGDLGLDEDHARSEPHVGRQEAENFTRPQAWPDAGEEAQGKEGVLRGF